MSSAQRDAGVFFSAVSFTHSGLDEILCAMCGPLQKVQAIVNPKVAIKFAPLSNKPLLDVLQRCLMRDPTKRPSIKQLLQHEFLYPVPVAQSMWCGGLEKE